MTRRDRRRPYRALVRPPGARHVEVIDQRALPHALVRVKIADADAAALAIRKMWIRGAPLIGAVGAYGLALALDRDASDAALAARMRALDATRPTAVNLRWALDRVRAAVRRCAVANARRRRVARKPTRSSPRTCAINHAIGEHGLALLRGVAQRRAGPVQRHDPLQRRRARDVRLGHGDGAGVSRACRRPRRCTSGCRETRPRLQGANLTAWELAQRGIPHTLVRRQRERRC